MSDQYDIFTEVTSEEFEDHSVPASSLGGIDYFAVAPPPSTSSASSSFASVPAPKKQDGFLPSSLGVEEDRNASRFSFQVVNPTSVGEGMSAYVKYTVVCKSTAEGWIWRYYFNFVIFSLLLSFSFSSFSCFHFTKSFFFHPPSPFTFRMDPERNLQRPPFQ